MRRLAKQFRPAVVGQWFCFVAWTVCFALGTVTRQVAGWKAHKQIPVPSFDFFLSPLGGALGRQLADEK